jgi:hypothetical protein
MIPLRCSRSWMSWRADQERGRARGAGTRTEREGCLVWRCGLLLVSTPDDPDRQGQADRLTAVPIIHLILSSPAISSPNLPISSGSTTTPLHVASEIGRADVGESMQCHLVTPAAFYALLRCSISNSLAGRPRAAPHSSGT